MSRRYRDRGDPEKRHRILGEDEESSGNESGLDIKHMQSTRKSLDLSQYIDGQWMTPNTFSDISLIIS
jgi:hypothetical protein